MNPLYHVAIIMDGNGRWGLKNKNSRNAGHRAGLNTVEKIIKETSRRKNSSLSRKRSSSNATNIFAESAKENIFSRKSFARKNSLFNKNFFL